MIFVCNIPRNKYVIKQLIPVVKSERIYEQRICASSSMTKQLQFIPSSKKFPDDESPGAGSRNFPISAGVNTMTHFALE